MRPALHNRPIIIHKLSAGCSDFRTTFELPEGSVVLYLLDLVATGTDESRWRKLLSPDEQKRAIRFHFDRDRQYYCATRGVLRTLLGAYLQTFPADLTFQYTEKGKPSLSSRYQDCDVEFNVSHSGEFALLGFTRGSRLGVDIEKFRDDFDSAAIARRFFSQREQHELSLLPVEQQHEAFFRCWTRKEAFIKALGEGLSHPLDRFDVSLNNSGPVSLETRPNADDAAHWWLHSVDAGPGYTAAIAVSQR